MRELWQPARASDIRAKAVTPVLESAIAKISVAAPPAFVVLRERRRKRQHFNRTWLKKHFRGNTVAILSREQFVSAIPVF